VCLGKLRRQAQGFPTLASVTTNRHLESSRFPLGPCALSDDTRRHAEEIHWPFALSPQLARRDLGSFQCGRPLPTCHCSSFLMLAARRLLELSSASAQMTRLDISHRCTRMHQEGRQLPNPYPQKKIWSTMPRYRHQAAACRTQRSHQLWCQSCQKLSFLRRSSTEKLMHRL